MRKISLIIVIFFITAAFAEQPFDKKHNSTPVITFGSTNSPDSLLFKQANVILKIAFSRLGYQFELMHLPNKRSLVWANENKIDGIAFRIDRLNNKLYTNLVKVDEVLFTLEQFVFSRETINPESWQSLAPYTVAYEQGTQFIEQHQSLFKSAIAVGDSEQAFQLVFHQRADLTITSAKTGQAILDKNQTLFNGAIKQQKPPLVQIKLYSYLHQSHQALATQLASTLFEMKRDGEFQRILNQIQ